MQNWFDQFVGSIEDGIKLGIQSGFESLGEMVKESTEQWFKIPEPIEPYRKIRSFHPKTDLPISQGYISIEKDCWEIFAYEPRKILMFELPAPRHLQECIVLLQMQVKSSGLQKPVSFSLGMQSLGGWHWSHSASVEGTTGWHRLQIPFHYKKAEFTGTIQFSLEFKDGGVLWLRDLETFQALVRS
jgi:hypothetical protein